VGAVHELEDVIPWDFDVRVLENGDSPGSIEAISTGRVMLQKFRFAWKLHQRGATPRGMRTFGVGVEPGQKMPFCGYPLEDDWLVAFPTTSGFDAVSSQSFHTYGLSVDETLLDEVAEVLRLPGPAEAVPHVSVYGADRVRVSGIRVSLNQIFHATRQQLEQDQQSGLSRRIEWDLVGQLLCLLAGGPPEARARIRHRDRALRRCLDYVEQSATRLIGVQELCEISGASWRTLDYAFKERFGVTPKAFLSARRLNAVQQELRDAKPVRGAVGRAAGALEFWHMGDFARDYRRLFGELPSETLRR